MSSATNVSTIDTANATNTSGVFLQLQVAKRLGDNEALKAVPELRDDRTLGLTIKTAIRNLVATPTRVGRDDIYVELGSEMNRHMEFINPGRRAEVVGKIHPAIVATVERVLRGEPEPTPEAKPVLRTVVPDEAAVAVNPPAVTA